MCHFPYISSSIIELTNAPSCYGDTDIGTLLGSANDYLAVVPASYEQLPPAT